MPERTILITGCSSGIGLSCAKTMKARGWRVLATARRPEDLDRLERDIGEIYREGGTESLIALPNIGRGIASAIAELLRAGRLTRLERLRGALEPEQLFQIVPGIGPKLAARIHDQLGIDTLEELELAAHDGRLETVTGISRRRAQMIKAALQSLLTAQRPAFHRDSASGPDVGLLLDLDKAYREKAAEDALPKIAPKRFNPEHKAWLPVMHENVGSWHFTVLFSNTARAHELGRTGDWVVIYFYNDHHEEGQHTVVTETSGPLAGERVVRGRETECRAYYR